MPTIFINNLKKIVAPAYPLFSFFASCPLVVIYLDPGIREHLPVPSDISSIPNLHQVLNQLRTRVLYNLPTFSTANENIDATIDVLKRARISPSLFRQADLPIIKSVLEEYFKPPIATQSINKMKDEIREGLKW